MAPKRKESLENGSSKAISPRRRSKRTNNNMNYNKKNQPITSSNKTSKSKRKNNKRYAANGNEKNKLDVIVMEQDSSKDAKSMSIDSTETDSIDEELLIAGCDDSDTSNSNDEIKSSTINQCNIGNDDDDDTEEFKSMFMANTVTPKSRPNYVSTPLVRTQRRNQTNVFLTTDPILTPQVINKTRDLSSSNATRQQLTTAHASSQSLNMSTNAHINNSSSLTQMSTSNQLSSSINYSTNNSAILETFAEYRALKRELQRALSLNESWKKDYQVLIRRMKRLQNSSFPRPNVDGRAFLEQLLDSIRSTDQDEDNRTTNQLANDMGLPETTLLSFSNPDPQKTSLKIFNAMFPTYRDKEALVNVMNIENLHPQLLNNILLFARRCAPGSGYSLSMLKEAIGNSIRCARHKLKTEQNQLVAIAALHADPLHENDLME